MGKPKNTGTPGLRDNRLQATGVPQSVYLTPSLANPISLSPPLALYVFMASVFAFSVSNVRWCISTCND